MKARKRFGQHFLTDAGVIDAIVDAVNVTTHDSLLEIGPGQGALTKQLYGLPRRFVAIEIDRDLVPLLNARFADLEIINADVLKAPLNALLEQETWRLVGNLPYNISSPLMVRLAELVRAGQVFADAHFMLQKEMAARMVAEPGSKAWGRLSVILKLTFDIEHLFDVPPESFTPPPKVDSSVIRLVPRADRVDLSEEDWRRLDEVLRMAFSQRRKRIANALKSLQLDFDELEIDPGLRADDLTCEQFIAMASRVERRPRQEN